MALLRRELALRLASRGRRRCAGAGAAPSRAPPRATTGTGGGRATGAGAAGARRGRRRRRCGRGRRRLRRGRRRRVRRGAGVAGAVPVPPPGSAGAPPPWSGDTGSSCGAVGVVSVGVGGAGVPGRSVVVARPLLSSLPVAAPSSIFEHAHHEVVPDLGREGAAGDRLAVVLGLHVLELVRVADPDRDGVAVGEADEPGVAVVLRRAGLAGGPDRDVRARAGAGRDDVVQQAARRCWRRPRAARAPSCARSSGPRRRSSTLVDGRRGDLLRRREGPVDALAVVGDRRVGVRHLERRDALLQAAERHRRVGRHVRADAQPLGQPRDLLRVRSSGRARRTPSCPTSAVACASVVTPA